MMKKAHETRNPVGILFVAVILLFLSIVPVSADQLAPTLTKVYFEENGSPVNESLSFTMNCYGYTCKWYDCGYTCRQYGCGNPEITPSPGAYVPEIVFSFSATCPSYGCTIYEPYYLNYRHVDRCDIEGDLGGEKFIVRNFSDTPIPNCTSISQAGMYDGKNYFRVTPEYLDCTDRVREEKEECDRYLEPISKDQEQYLYRYHGIIDTVLINGTVYNITSDYQACLNEYNKKTQGCSQYLQKINTSDMIMDPTTNSPVSRMCELRVSLPSSGTTGNQNSSGLRTGTDPFHGIFCFLNRIFGGTC